MPQQSVEKFTVSQQLPVVHIGMTLYDTSKFPPGKYLDFWILFTTVDASRSLSNAACVNKRSSIRQSIHPSMSPNEGHDYDGNRSTKP